MDDILTISTAEIARRIKAKELTPIDAVEAHIRRIEQVNPTINAVVTPTFEQARKEAQAAQERIERDGTDDLPPLFGVPVTIKDCWAVKDVRFTGGSWHWRDYIADEDAESVQLLREAGAIILGKTNLPDMCWAGDSVNPIFGRTNNPRNNAYSAGGSSGGEGAIIAAGGSPLGLGSDIAGSVRIPAALNGCVSLKPTAGRVPSGDHVPEVTGEIGNWNTAGPMARRVEDLALAMSVLSRTPFADYTQIDLNGLSGTFYVHNGEIPVHGDVEETVLIARRTLKQAGMTLKRDETLPFAPVLLLYMALMQQHGNISFRRALGGGTPYDLSDEIKRHLNGEGRISPVVMWFTEATDVLGWYSRLRGYKSFDQLQKCREEMLDKMGDVILCPVFLRRPAKHGWTWLTIWHLPYTLMFNALGFPAAVVPIRYTPEGPPLVVQVVGRPDEDEKVLAVAAELERVHGGWKPIQVR